MERKAYNAKGINVSGPYSHAVDGGDYIFLSGQTAMNKEGASGLEGQIQAQTMLALDNLFAVLEELGLDQSHVVKVNAYLTSMADFQEFNQAYEQRFTPPYPARTCLAVYQLPLGAEVEIELIARK